MTLKNLFILVVAPLVLSSVSFNSAQAQEFKVYEPPSFVAPQRSMRATWNLVLAVSAVVAAIGLIQDESALVVIGGAGIVISLLQSDRSRFTTLRDPIRGFDLHRSGAATFGFSPFDTNRNWSRRSAFKPSIYIAAKFKF